MASTNTENVRLEELQGVIDKNLQVLGFTPEESVVVSAVLMYAQLRDKSQGLIKIVEKSIVPDTARTAMAIEQKTPVVSLLKANGHAGMVVLDKAAKLAVESCNTMGIALVGTTETCTSTGSIGYYAEQVADAGFIGMVMAGSPKVMAVQGSMLPALGTNPLAIAVPTGAGSLVLDMATSATTWFDLIQSARSNTPIEPGLALDSSGQPTTDASAALAGALLTFGGSKGSGLALMIELLTAPMMGAAIVGESHDSRASLIIAINPGVIVDNYLARVDQLLQALRDGPLLPGTEELRLPGDRSAYLAQQRIAAGSVPVDSEIYRQLLENCKS